MKRFFWDAGILLVFCGVFYLLTVLVGWFEGDTGSDDSDFSLARKKADVLLSRKNWVEAESECKKLTEQDPLNAYAWHSYAKCLWEQRSYLMFQYESWDSPDLQSSAEAIELKQQIDDLSGRTRDVLLQLKKFARYRPICLLQLAAIECDRGDYQEAMDYLEEYVGRGYQTTRGLDWIEQFGFSGSTGGSSNEPPHPRMKFAEQSPGYQLNFNLNFSEMNLRTGVGSRLHLEPRFWEIVKKERESY